MATRYAEALPNDLRYEPTPKWVRGELGGQTVVDSKRALLVWEPEQVVPGYAFPEEDVRADALPGEAVKRFDDPDLEGYVAVRWDALDRWLEEEEQVFGHPRDPFKRIDVRRSSRHVRVELDGDLLAESRRPALLFETGLPVRYYLPREDVRVELLPSERVTWCAYKGQATHYSVEAGGQRHEALAWCYSEPLDDARDVQGLIAFYNERTDITVDGQPEERPVTQWSDSR